MTTFTAHDHGMPCWIDVMVATEEQHHDTRAFLSALFNWTWDVGSPEMGSYSIALVDGAPVFGLGVDERAKGDVTTYFASADINDSVKCALNLGASVVAPVMDVMDLGKMALLLDPAGAPFGFWQAGTFLGFGVMYQENTPGWFDHVSSEPQRDGEFYAAITGHQLTPMEGDMRILQNGDQWFASVTHAQGGEHAQWKPIIVVDALERIHEAVPRLGGTIVLAEMPVPGSAICVFSEPVSGTLMTVMRAGHAPE